MRRTSQAVAFAVAALLLPASARAQDASVLVLLAAPPFFLAPVVTAVARYAWMRRLPGSRFALRSGVMLSALEFVLWLLVAWFAAVVYFQQACAAAVVLAALLALIVVLNRRFAPPQRSWWIAIALAGVFPAAWFIVQLAWYGAVVLWGEFRVPA